MAIPVLRAKNQVTIPVAVSSAAGIRVGDPLDITYADGAIRIRVLDTALRHGHSERPAESAQERAAGPSVGDWLDAAEFVGVRDRELLDRLGR